MNRVMNRVKYDSILGITEISQYLQQPLSATPLDQEQVIILCVLFTSILNCDLETKPGGRSTVLFLHSQRLASTIRLLLLRQFPFPGRIRRSGRRRGARITSTADVVILRKFCSNNYTGDVYDIDIYITDVQISRAG
jgi:hypothetical protein